MYTILVHTDNDMRKQLVKGLQSFITSKVMHPAVGDMFSTHSMSATVEKSIVLAAIVHEPDFLQHLMDREDTCNSALSQYTVQVLPSLLEQLLNGQIALDTFVLKATHEYIIL